MKNKITVGIIGGAGYTGGELLRVLLNHPLVEIKFVHSRSNSGNFIHNVHTDLIGETQLNFSSVGDEVDALFLCLGHGESKKWMDAHSVSANCCVIDLSQDFRYGVSDFIYALPEFNRGKIMGKKRIANPGCFATAIQLALLPLAEKQLLNNEIQIIATTGSTGAGQSLSTTSHFTWRYGNHSSYKELDHQHLNEIGKTLSDSGNDATLHFIPQRGAFTRGIHAVIHFENELSEMELKDIYKIHFASHPFTHLATMHPDLKQVVNTNKCILHVSKKSDRVIITSVIDNLLKGASGQAVQNMNLAFGFEETTGLKLKPSAY